MNDRDAHLRAERLERMMAGAVMLGAAAAAGGGLAWFAWTELGALGRALSGL